MRFEVLAQKRFAITVLLWCHWCCWCSCFTSRGKSAAKANPGCFVRSDWAVWRTVARPLALAMARSGWWCWSRLAGSGASRLWSVMVGLNFSYAACEFTFTLINARRTYTAGVHVCMQNNNRLFLSWPSYGHVGVTVLEQCLNCMSVKLLILILPLCRLCSKALNLLSLKWCGRRG